MPVSQRLSAWLRRSAIEKREWEGFWAEKEAGRALRADDEETLVMFVAQAAAARDVRREVGWGSGIDQRGGNALRTNVYTLYSRD